MTTTPDCARCGHPSRHHGGGARPWPCGEPPCDCPDYKRLSDVGDPLTTLTAAFWGPLPIGPLGGVDARRLAQLAIDELRKAGFAVTPESVPTHHGDRDG